MSDNGEEEEDEPVVELGDGPDVEGAPVSRVASRLFFPIERSEVLRREGETTIRTPDGPRTVDDVLEETDEVYFERDADLLNAVRSVVGTGPVPTAGGSGGDGAGGSEPETAAVEASETGSEESADEGEDAEVAEGAETAESPGTDPDAETGAEGDSDADAEDGGFEFDEE